MVESTKSLVQIYRQHYNSLCSFATRLTNNFHESEDIVSSAFLRAFSSTKSFYEETHIVRYLYILVNSMAIESSIKRKQIEDIPDTDFDYNYVDISAAEMLSSEVYDNVRKQFEKLPPRLRTIFKLRYYEQHTMGDIADKFGVSALIVRNLMSNGLKILRDALLQNENTKPDTLFTRVKLDEINAELIRHLAKHPEQVHNMSPRKFEELIAELFRDMGYDIFLTPQSRDGGRDILAVLRIPCGQEILTIVECKKNRPDRPIGIDVLRSFLWTLRDGDRANFGLVATTSYFSDKAQALQKQFKWLLNLKNYGEIKEWLSNYGKWKQSTTHQGLWLPNNPML